MSKKLDTNAITNELEHSSFFPARPEATNQPSSGKTMSTTAVQPPILDVIPTPAVKRPKAVPLRSANQQPKVTPATERGYVRRTFDIFEDQLAYLTRVSLEDRLAGGEGSMNSMVREALDAFIQKRKLK